MVSPAHTSFLVSYSLLDISTWMPNRHLKCAHVPKYTPVFFPKSILVTAFHIPLYANPLFQLLRPKTLQPFGITFYSCNLSGNHAGFTFKIYPKYGQFSLLLLPHPDPSSNHLLSGLLQSPSHRSLFWSILNTDTSVIPSQYDRSCHFAQDPAMVSPFHSE